MKTVKLSAIAVAVGVVLAVSGCTNTQPSNHSHGNNNQQPVAVSTGSADGNVNFNEVDSNAHNQKDLMSQLTFYFDFDRSDINAAGFPSLEAHGRYLADHPNAHLRAEGHCDERGSREYNVALGERRALAIARVLMLSGADKSQISVVSYGEEKPAVRGHDEMAYSKNRRAVLVYEAS